MKKVIHLSNIRATELKYNDRVYPPKAAEHKLETNLQQTKSALEEVFSKYINENCDRKGELEKSKTGSLSFETKHSFLAGVEPHIGEDEDFNGIGRAMTRFLRVGKARRADRRIIEVMMTTNITLPVVSLYGKDHKEISDEEKKEKGPPRRAVGHVTDGVQVRVSNLAAKVLNEIADKENPEHELKSREDLQAKFEAWNKTLRDEALKQDDETNPKR